VMAVLIVGWMLAAVLSYFLRHSALSITVDRVLGAFFGVVRGAVVVAVAVLLGQFAHLDGTSWWKNSSLLPYAVECASWIQTFAETGIEMLEATTQLERGAAA